MMRPGPGSGDTIQEVGDFGKWICWNIFCSQTVRCGPEIRKRYIDSLIGVMGMDISAHCSTFLHAARVIHACSEQKLQVRASPQNERIELTPRLVLRIFAEPRRNRRHGVTKPCAFGNRTKIIGAR